MRYRVLGAAFGALTLLTAACGGDADDSAQPEAVDGVAAEPSPQEASSEATAGSTEEVMAAAGGEPSDGASTGGAGGTGGGSESTVLIGMVGTAENPEAFEITLTDESGEPITVIPAGEYTIQVSDPASSHNFHLTGGSVDETTSVPEQVETTFQVTLEAGEYTYTCDPHPAMTGTFRVT